MATVASHLSTGLWRLVPGNPILVRVVHGSSRRLRHFYIRLGYLTILFAVMLVAVLGTGSDNASLGELAKTYSASFRNISLAQLTLMCFLSPVFAAAAITQERDAQTYDILLTTPMSNAQIVLGSLLSRLFFVIMLLLSGLPIACITMVYGGVTTPVVLRSFAVSAATAILTGSLAIAVSVIQIGTRRTVFSFYMFIGVYLAAVGAAAWHPFFQVPNAPVNADFPPMSFLAPFHPFLALFTGMNMVQAPAPELVARYAWPMRTLLANPTGGFIAVSLIGSVLLVAASMFFVRSGARQGEETWFSRLQFWKKQQHDGERRQKPRRVWRNPVAWREAATRASVTSRTMLRIFYVGGGGVLGAGLFIAYITGARGMTAQDAKNYLTGLIFVEFATILLVATNVAATAISKEKESGTLDLLLATPLTSRYIIWGKLRGLISFTLPLICVPVATCGLFSLHALFTGSGAASVVFPETVLILAGLMLIFAASACMLGIYRSLISKTTLQAVLSSIAILVLAGGATSMCGLQIVDNGSAAAAVLAPFTPFTAIFVAVDPAKWMGLDVPVSASTLRQVRAWSAVGGALVVLIYGAIVHAAYRSMVRNFDMTLRKQSA